MDLLIGYASSDEDSSSSSPSSSKNKERTATINSDGIRSRKADAPPPQQQQQQRRGKKILSLASVLPPHILAALTKAGAAGEGDSSSSSSTDDDGSGDEGATEDGPQKSTRLRHPQRTTTATKPPFVTTLSSDATEISSLLADLRRTIPEHSTAKSLTVGATSTANENAPSSASRMGAAFLQSTTVTSTRTNDAVRNIHGEDAPKREDANRETKGTEVSAADSFSTGGGKAAAAAVFDAVVPVEASGEAPLAFARPIIRAAPRISAAPSATPTLHPAQQQQHPQAATAVVSQSHGSATDTDRSSVLSDGNSKKKRSRKQMERDLRQGRMAEVLEDEDSFSQSVQGADPTAYCSSMPLNPASFAASAATSTAGIVRNVATPMYDPSAGTTVTGKTAHVARGKNQINQLLAQAAHLERERVQQQQQAGASGGTQSHVKMHRANAKRKYGW